MNLLYSIQQEQLLFYKDTEVMDELYYLKATVPTEINIIKYMSENSNNAQIKLINSYKSHTDLINHIKLTISQIEHKMPLYDEYSKNMYIISKENLYDRVIYEYYRFPDQDLINILKDRYNNLANLNKTVIKKRYGKRNIIEINRDLRKKELNGGSKLIESNSDILHQREVRKLRLMLEFLDNFDIEILKNTYIKLLYYYSTKIGKNITVCIKPSFLPYLRHLTPYYTKTEIINMALNMGLKDVQKETTNDNIMDLCKLVTENDISSKIIMKHHTHIIKNNKLGIMQYYTLQGSYFLNSYLITYTKNSFKNKVLEEKIFSIWNLINTSPPFNKEYIVYRFIPDDFYLNHLKPGDIFKSPSFISTTRNPFYKQEDYKFGFILLKIKIPGKQEGVALCIETVSNFPNEQEIILSPSSILRLDNKDENVPYYHTDDNYQSQIKTRYEFTYIGKGNITLKNRISLKNEAPYFDPLKYHNLTINQFINEHTDELLQFTTNIGKRTFVLLMEMFDSTGAYRKFYASNTNNGYIIYTFIGDYIGFTIEIGEDNEGKYMHVNYYYRYSTVPKENNIKDKDLLVFVSKIAWCFGIMKIAIYATYRSCDFNQYKTISGEQAYYDGGIYCEDFYEYFLNGKKKYLAEGITYGFDYKILDELKNISPKKILDKQERNELYQIYDKIYKGNDNISDFYIWLVENHCKNTQYLAENISKIYKKNNPFKLDYYIMDVKLFMYKNNLITKEMFDTIKDKDIKIKIKKIPMNQYRINNTTPRY